MTKVLFCLMMLFAVTSNVCGQDSVSLHKRTEVRYVPDSVADRMKRDKDFAYANDMRYWQDEKPRQRTAFDKLLSALSESTALKVILYALLVAAILYVVYHVMVVNNFFIFSRGRKNKKVNDHADGDAINENLDQLISDAIAAGNYRHAIRYMYLRTLKLLSENKVITLHAKSTNQDYIRQMYKHNSLSQFRHLTRIYEYVWYGEFDPTATQFDIIQTNFNKFNHNS